MFDVSKVLKLLICASNPINRSVFFTNHFELWHCYAPKGTVQPNFQPIEESKRVRFYYAVLEQPTNLMQIVDKIRQHPKHVTVLIVKNMVNQTVHRMIPLAM